LYTARLELIHFNTLEGKVSSCFVSSSQVLGSRIKQTRILATLSSILAMARDASIAWPEIGYSTLQRFYVNKKFTVTNSFK